MSENHLSNLIEKLAEAEAKLEELKKLRETAKYFIREAVQQNMKMKDIESLEEDLDNVNNRVNYEHALVLNLRRRIKRTS